MQATKDYKELLVVWAVA